jgi:Gram-negative bacterial TonB protein C-terminal
MSTRPSIAALFALLLSCVAFSQDKPKTAPLPYDPLELATGPTAVPDTPQKRELVLHLLEHARQNNGMHAPGTTPFSMKVSFNSTGTSRYTGFGEVEETWMSPGTFRWSARLGDYSQLRIFNNGAAYDDKPRGSIPLRIQMVRQSVFWPVTGRFAPSLIRVATANWQGTEVACMLVSGAMNDAASTPGRRWEETEYCIDPKSGLLRTYSEAPGIYNVYDYSEKFEFHGRTLARQISIVEDGVTVLQIHLDSLADAANSDPDQFVPTKKMLSHGPGDILVGPFRFPQSVPAPPGHNGMIQPVIVHAVLDKKGHVVEAEALQHSDSVLTDAALTIVERSNYRHADREGRPVQREAFINVQFIPPQ